MIHQDGKTYEPTGEVRIPYIGEHYMTKHHTPDRIIKCVNYLADARDIYREVPEDKGGGAMLDAISVCDNPPSTLRPEGEPMLTDEERAAIDEKLRPVMGTPQQAFRHVAKKYLDCAKENEGLKAELAKLREENERLREVWEVCDQTVMCAFCEWIDWPGVNGEPAGTTIPHWDKSPDCPIAHTDKHIHALESELTTLRAQVKEQSNGK